MTDEERKALRSLQNKFIKVIYICEDCIAALIAEAYEERDVVSALRKFISDGSMGDGYTAHTLQGTFSVGDLMRAVDALIAEIARLRADRAILIKYVNGEIARCEICEHLKTTNMGLKYCEQDDDDNPKPCKWEFKGGGK
jgi:hypothetical protein